MDEEHHLPLALEMLAVLCGDDQEKWREAEQTVGEALNSRITLWTGVVEQTLKNPSEAGHGEHAEDRLSDAGGR